MVMTNTDALHSNDYVTYDEAASILGVTRGTVDRAVNTCILTSVRFPGSGRGGRKYIPRFEVEALEGLTVNSRRAKEHLERVRRARGVEQQYSVDGTVDWVPKSDLERVIAENNAVMEEVRQQMHALGDILLGMADGLSDEKLESKVKSFLERMVANAK